MKTRVRLFVVAAAVTAMLALASCGSGATLTSEQARGYYIEARGAGVYPDSVKVNGIIACDLDDEDKVQHNVDAAWLVHYEFISTRVEGEQTLALVVGEKDGEYKTVQQGGCP